MGMNDDKLFRSQMTPDYLMRSTEIPVTLHDFLYLILIHS